MPNEILIGSISGIAVFAVLTLIRNSFRYAIIRKIVSEDYLLGWKDACREMKERLLWVETTGSNKTHQR